jgi:hypothetical protein
MMQAKRLSGNVTITSKYERKTSIDGIIEGSVNDFSDSPCSISSSSVFNSAFKIVAKQRKH